MPVVASVRFGWPVSTAGHEWIDARLVRDDWSLSRECTRVLVPKDVRIVVSDFWNRPGHELLKDVSGLFREFAALPIDEEAIREFADVYGSLTTGALVVPKALAPSSLPARPRDCLLSDLARFPYGGGWQKADAHQTRWNKKGARNGDTFEMWAEQIALLKYLMVLWEAIRGRDLETMKKLFSVEEKEVTKILPNQDYVPLYSGIELPRDRKGRPAPIPAAAEILLKYILGEEFANRVRCVLPPANSREWRFSLEPRTLCDALWLQFALAVSESKQYRNCQVCGKPFEISKEVANKNRTLCSPACKAKAHRDRRAQAIQLAAQGKTHRQIARAVGSKLSTVEGWLGTTDDEQST